MRGKSARKKPKKKIFNSIEQELAIAACAVVFLPIAIYFGYKAYASTKIVIPVAILALICGIFFEFKRIGEKWSTIINTALCAFVVSFIVFIPSKKEYVYDLEKHLIIWPYYFIFIFLIVAVVLTGEKTIAKLTEGITLLQSIAIIYWIADIGILSISNYYLKALLIIALLFVIYSFYHAFTHTKHSRTSRLILSIWSSVIMVLFASDNIYKVHQNEHIEMISDIDSKLFIALQYFLLGTSCIYIFQNLYMLLHFLPGKGQSREDYKKNLKELKNQHINRYSDQQVNHLYSMICLVFASIFFSLNYYFQFFPRNIAIWLVFLCYPYILSLYSYLQQKKTVTINNLAE